jgi:hypothetical protein
MAEADRMLGMYLHLARASQMRRQPMVQVKLLVLAGVQAEGMGLAEIAALCRHKVLAINARHLLRRWPTIQEALAAEPFQAYLKQLRRRYSGEKIEHMVQSLGIEMGQERAAYFSDREYAAALLDTPLESIAGVLAGGAGNGAGARGSETGAKGEDTERSAASLHAGHSGTAQAGSGTQLAAGLLLVWGPFVAGLAALVGLAIAAL